MTKTITIILMAAFPFLCFANSFDSPFGRVPTVSQKEAAAIKSAAECANDAEALEILGAASEHKWASAAIWFNLANLQMRTGKTAEAVESYKKSLAAEPSFFMAEKNLAFALSRLGKESEAFGEMKKALALSGGSDVPILLWLASRYAKAADYSAALNFCNQALLYDAENTEAVFAKAVFLYETESFADCEKFARRLLENKSFSAQAIRLVGKSRARRNDFIGALSAFEILKKSGEATAADLSFLGDLLFGQKLYAEAAENYAAAKNENSANRVAMACVCGGDFQKALEISKSLRSPDREKIKGLAKIGLGDLQGARKSLSEYVSANPSDAFALCRLAEACFGLGDYSEAEAYYSQVSPDSDFEQAALYGLMKSALARKDYKGALICAKEIEKKYSSREISAYVKYLESYCANCR